MKQILTTAALVFLAHASVVLADTSVVTEGEVRGWLARIPNEGALLGSHPLDAQPSGFERTASPDVVRAIVRHARSREEASLLTVFAAFESGARSRGKDGRCIAGDGGRSYGYLQENIAHAGMAIACDPDAATRWWLALRDDAAARCPESPLAPIIGGCNVPKARRQAVARAALAARLAAP